jgi:hypothetical protein
MIQLQYASKTQEQRGKFGAEELWFGEIAVKDTRSDILMSCSIHFLKEFNAVRSPLPNSRTELENVSLDFSAKLNTIGRFWISDEWAETLMAVRKNRTARQYHFQ